MSIWASVSGPEITVYDSGYGDTIPEDGFIDVAVSCLGGRVRIIHDRTDNGTDAPTGEKP